MMPIPHNTELKNRQQWWDLFANIRPVVMQSRMGPRNPYDFPLINAIKDIPGFVPLPNDAVDLAQMAGVVARSALDPVYNATQGMAPIMHGMYNRAPELPGYLGTHPLVAASMIGGLGTGAYGAARIAAYEKIVPFPAMMWLRSNVLRKTSPQTYLPERFKRALYEALTERRASNYPNLGELVGDELDESVFHNPEVTDVVRQQLSQAVGKPVSLDDVKTVLRVNKPTEEVLLAKIAGAIRRKVPYHRLNKYSNRLSSIFEGLMADDIFHTLNKFYMYNPKPPTPNAALLSGYRPTPRSMIDALRADMGTPMHMADLYKWFKLGPHHTVPPTSTLLKDMLTGNWANDGPGVMSTFQDWGIRHGSEFPVRWTIPADRVDAFRLEDIADIQRRMRLIP